MPVTLAGTWAETLARARDHGITVEEAGTTWTARVATAQRDALPAAAFDVTLVVVKAHQTADVAPAAARATTEDGLIATLQNGWGNRELLQAAAPGRVAAGITVTGIAVAGPAHVRGNYGRTVLGSDAATEKRVRQLAALLNDAGLATEVSDTIDGHIWAKLAVNSRPQPAVRAPRPHQRRAGRRSRGRAPRWRPRRARSARWPARAGPPIDGDAAQTALAVARHTADNRSSMLQDVDRGVATEVDFINGAVCREGVRLGIPTPVNDHLWRAMRERQGLADPLPVTA